MKKRYLNFCVFILTLNLNSFFVNVPVFLYFLHAIPAPLIISFTFNYMVSTFNQWFKVIQWQTEVCHSGCVLMKKKSLWLEEENCNRSLLNKLSLSTLATCLWSAEHVGIIMWRKDVPAWLQPTSRAGQAEHTQEGNWTCWGSLWLLCKGDTEKHAVSTSDSACRLNQAELLTIREARRHVSPRSLCRSRTRGW